MMDSSSVKKEPEDLGEKYDNTRHNIGFKIADALVKEYDESFTTEKLLTNTKYGTRRHNKI